MKQLIKLTALVIGLVLAFSCISCNNGSNEEEPQHGGQTGGTQSSLAALNTLKDIDGFPGVYTIEYDGDYKLDEAINSNLISSEDLLDYIEDNLMSWKTNVEAGAPLRINVQGAACSSIVAENTNPDVGGYIIGRNFDWEPGSSLILHAMPDNGYESVSTCFLEFVSDESDWAPNDDVFNNAVAIACVYVPMDGMNEKGLYIANLNSNGDARLTNTDDTSKKNVQTTIAIRYILDKCSTVAEAVAWLETINMCPVYGDEVLYHNSGVPVYSKDYHFAIADNSGHSVVVEWIGGEMKVTETKVVTNHYLDEDNRPDTANGDKDLESSLSRYQTLEEAGKAQQWKMNTTNIKQVLSSVQQMHSVWSAIFEPSAKRVTYYFRDTNAADDDDTPIDYTKSVVVQF